MVIAPTALGDLVALIRSHSLPANTLDRVRHALRPLSDHPLLGAPLEGRWQGFRFILGPWRWMIVVYAYDEETAQVSIITVQDGRSAGAATAAG